MQPTPVRRSPQQLSGRRAFRLFSRALSLRCPHCGGRGLFISWLTMKPSCPTCGLRLERGESDYFLGAYLFNLIAVEILLALTLLGVVVATWPDPPWSFLQWGGAALLIAGAVLCYPFAKTTWLAFDIMMRPVTAEELERGAVQD